MAAAAATTVAEATMAAAAAATNKAAKAVEGEGVGDQPGNARSPALRNLDDHTQNDIRRDLLL